MMPLSAYIPRDDGISQIRLWMIGMMENWV